LQTPGSRNRLWVAGERLIVAGGATDQMDGAIVFARIMRIYGENGMEFTGLCELGEVEAVVEAGETPGVAISVKPYIIV
jgi:hypothetical protein